MDRGSASWQSVHARWSQFPCAQILPCRKHCQEKLAFGRQMRPMSMVVLFGEFLFREFMHQRRTARLRVQTAHSRARAQVAVMWLRAKPEP